MGKKKKLTAYLAGALEAAADLGAGWRTEITPFLEEQGFEVLNPWEFEPFQLKGLQPNRLPEFYTDGLSGKKSRRIINPRQSPVIVGRRRWGSGAALPGSS